MPEPFIYVLASYGLPDVIISVFTEQPVVSEHYSSKSNLYLAKNFLLNEKYYD